MSKENIHINEFLTDAEFVRWVRDPDKELEVYWLKWMEAHPDKREDLKLAREIIQGLQFEPKLPDPTLRQAVLTNILNGSSKDIRGLYDNRKNSPKNQQYLPSFWIRVDQFSKVAAILVLALALSVTVNYLHKAPPKPAAVALVKTINKATAYGEKLNFRLPDGSLVWLNAGSELNYPEKFDSLERVVYLKGEAFFEVEKGHDWPFSVICDNLTTTALGTSFNIKNERDGVLSISLISGKVKVENGLTDENVVLLPGQQLKYSQESNKTVIGSFGMNQVTGWKSGLLQFVNASFEEVREELEKWYGVKISVSGQPSRKWNLTGNYQDQNLELVLKRISYIEQLNFTIKDKSVQIKF
jgi:transmembrane sensor